MKKWYISVEHIPLHYGVPEGPSVLWAHGINDCAVGEEELTEDWLNKHGFKTKAAAIRSSRLMNDRHTDRFWGVGNVVVKSGDVPDTPLRYKIYKCYEIVILDKEDNEIGEVNYCYGTRADAEDMARHELKLAMMDAQNT